MIDGSVRETRERGKKARNREIDRERKRGKSEGRERGRRQEAGERKNQKRREKRQGRDKELKWRVERKLEIRGERGGRDLPSPATFLSSMCNFHPYPVCTHF